MSNTRLKVREALETLVSTAKENSQGKTRSKTDQTMNVGRKLRDLIRGRRK